MPIPPKNAKLSLKKQSQYYAQLTSHSIIRLNPAILSSPSRSNRLTNLGNLIPRPNNPASLIILHKLDILILPLRAFPNLDLTPTTNDTHAHGTEQVMRSITVHIHAAIEHSRGIFANPRTDHCLPTRMILDEIGDIVDNARDGDEAPAVLGLVDVIVPFHDGQRIKRDTPVEFRAFLIEFLLELLDAAFFDLVLFELLQVISETELFPDPDGPLGGIVLVPFDSVAVVGRELMVEVVIAFSQGHQSRDDVVAGGVSVVEGLVA